MSCPRVRIGTGRDRRRRSYPAALVAAWLAGAVPAVAQDAEWTWERCRAAAFADRAAPELRAARHAIAAASARVAGAEAGRRPRADLRAGVGWADDAREDASGAAFGFVLGIGGEAPLWPSRGPRAERDARAAELAALRAAAARAEADYEAGLRAAFIELLAAQEYAEWVAQWRERRARLLDAVSARHLAGREHIGTVEVARAALAELEREVALAAEGAALRREALCARLGLSPAPFARAAGVLGCDPPPAAPPDWEACLAQSPEMAEWDAAAARGAARARAAAARDDGQLDAVARAAPQTDRWTAAEPDWFVGLRFTLPLFDGGRANSEQSAAVEDALEISARREARRRALGVELRAAWAEYRAAAERQALVPERLAAAARRAEIARREYEIGLAPLGPWEAAENDWSQKARQSLDIRRDAALAQARWERLAGAVRKGATP